ncbi:glycosyltransferase [Brasilonema sp. UFV-L1]|uniref:glycosyltransferase n=1 Tax=Brasilonema sp. UFV-L1 TaxID=2234130 RepID=UPI00145F48C0|nr:glycosyltransferase [Brasilonema sp. UFV-L1]NMG06805.1 glycosyl transferase [Brasilonema sp. UFV-L1]
MKITLICHDIPYPPNRGARVEMWRRIKAFYDIGVELQLISWFSEPLQPEEIAEVKKYVKEIYLIPFQHTLGSFARRIIDLLQYPLEVTSRIVRGKEFNTLLSDVRAFHPDVIWLDGIHGGEIADKLSKNLNVLLITRSHNIEYLYYRRLLASTTDFTSKLRRYLSVSHLESFEKDLLKRSALFYDISADDLKFWQSQGFKNGRYLPPIVEFPKDNNSKEACDEISANLLYDVVFLGNLKVDNNVAGIVWFLTQVLPVIRSALPSVKVLIAGSNPVKKIKQLCEEHQGVSLSINPASSIAVYQSGRVLMNPVLTGSGVSIKSIEMLVSGRPIVSTPQGIAGLPEEVRKFFKIAVDAQSFGEEIVRLLSTPQKLNVDQGLLESLFGPQIIEGVVSDINSLL